jgi:hypothetical protein
MHHLPPLPLLLSNAHLRQVLSFPQCSQCLRLLLHLRCWVISSEELFPRRMPPSSSPPTQELHKQLAAFLLLLLPSIIDPPLPLPLHRLLTLRGRERTLSSIC